MTKPFLLLSTRPEDDAVVGERAAILAKAGLEEAELAQHRVERFPLPDLDLGDFAGVLLGGGPFNSSDEDKSELQLRVEADIARVVTDAVERDVPLLGLCYGIGALTSTLGGVVDRTYGEPVGVVDVALTDEAGRFERYKLVDPSFHNWSALAWALRGAQISDFPLCNKSFNLSYCGHDL